MQPLTEFKFNLSEKITSFVFCNVSRNESLHSIYLRFIE